MRLPDGVQIKVIGFVLGEEEEVLPGIGEPVLDTGGHVIGFVPDDLVPQGPAPINHRQHEPLGNTQTAFVEPTSNVAFLWQIAQVLRENRSRPLCPTGIRRLCAASSVAVSEIDPTRARLLQNTLHLVKDLKELL